jgi:hypothetical protein
VSLILAHGHTGAMDYTIGRVFDEANIVTERENARILTEAQLVQMAASSVVSAKAGKQFGKMQKQLHFETEPVEGLFDQN